MNKIIISGLYRSGTSYLMSIFDNMKGYEVLHQPISLYSRYIQDEVYKNSKINKNLPLGFKNLNFLYFKKNKTNINKKKIIKITKTILKNKSNNKVFKYLNKDFFKVFLIELQRRNKLDLKDFFNALFSSIETYRRKKTKKKIFSIGFKENYLTSFYPFFLTIPKLTVINLIRDPREILVSRNYSTKKFQNNNLNKRHPVIMMAIMWKINALMVKNLEKKVNFFNVKFNDLIKNKKKIKFSNIHKILYKKKLYDKENLRKWKINSNHKSLLNTKKILLNYKSNPRLLSDIAIIEEICNNEMKYLKYKKFLNVQLRKKIIANFKEDKTQLLNWTKKREFFQYSTETIKYIKFLSKA